MEIRTATLSDISAIRHLMDRAIAELQSDYLTPEQVAASRAGMGLDSQLIEDGTYFCAWDGPSLAGCGGWSFRSTLYGGNHSAGRNASRLNPETDRARIRAMYTHPDFTRRGVGRLILERSEQAAKSAGFSALEMAATLAGEPFYLRCGYKVVDRWEDKSGDIFFPLLTMVKSF